MQARRDQVDAAKYLSARLNSALLSGDPDAQEPPTRRDSRGLIGGLILASLLVVAVGVYALIVPGGSTAWKQAGALVVDRDGGGRYVLVDGRLHPVRNVASARLLLGGSLKTVAVPAKALASTPRGNSIGIAGAPDGLPPVSGRAQEWRVCATAPSDLLPSAPTVRDVVQIGGTLPADTIRSAFVRNGDVSYLVVDGMSYPIPEQFLVDVLGLGQTEPTAVSSRWLSLLPQGPALQPPDLPGAGESGARLDGQDTKIGQLFDSVSAAGDRGHYQLRRDGLLALTPLQFRLLSSVQAAQRLVLSDYAIASAGRAIAPDGFADLPEIVPSLPVQSPGQVLCVQAVPGAEIEDLVPQVVLAPLFTGANPVTSGPGAGEVAVAAAPGGGALVATSVPDPDEPSNQDAIGDVHVVSDEGKAFPVQDREALTALGYTSDGVLLVSQSWLALLPTGPGLARPSADVLAQLGVDAG